MPLTFWSGVAIGCVFMGLSFLWYRDNPDSARNNEPCYVVMGAICCLLGLGFLSSILFIASIPNNAVRDVMDWVSVLSGIWVTQLVEMLLPVMLGWHEGRKGLGIKLRALTTIVLLIVINLKFYL